MKLEKTSQLGNFSLTKMAQPPPRAGRASSHPGSERLAHLIGVSHVSATSISIPSPVFSIRKEHCACVCPVHSSIKLGDDESRIIPPTVKVVGPQNPGQEWVRAWEIDASSPCTDRAPIIANVCYVLREGKIYCKGLFSLH